MSTDSLMPIPDGLVVLTFDDSNVSDYALAAPLLKKYGFGGTFFIIGDQIGEPNRLNWYQVRELEADGFEIGSHSFAHLSYPRITPEEARDNLVALNEACSANDVTQPVTFAYPGGGFHSKHFGVFREIGLIFARRAGSPEIPAPENIDRGPAYEPGLDHPYAVPTTAVFGPNCDMVDLGWAVDQARDGRIAVLDFHGVPDICPHCSVPPEDFRRYMKYLHDCGCTVIAMRDLAKYVDPNDIPKPTFAAIAARAGICPIEPRCEYAVDPIGVGPEAPRFSWLPEALRRDQKQTAYQILVATSEEQLAQDIGDMWDSGRVDSDRNVNVTYQGKPLVADTTYFWKARCWSRAGVPCYTETEEFYDQEVLEILRGESESPYTTAAAFSTGLFDRADWQGEWLAADKAISSPLLRKEFNLDTQVRRATVYVSGLGYYELYVNGDKVGDHVRDPATTHYEDGRAVPSRPETRKFGTKSRVLYVGYDITDRLRPGANAIAAMLGHGWYSIEVDAANAPTQHTPYDEQPVMLLQLKVEFVDGKTLQIVSDGSWKAMAGPITYNDNIHGETYDARLEAPGWCSSGFDDSAWPMVREVSGPAGRRVAQIMPPIKVVQTFKPVAIANPAEGVYVFDFGQAFTGWSQLKVEGPVGTEVKLKHGMAAYDDGSLDHRSSWNDEFPRHAARQTDTYILKGEGAEIWEPRFTVHGFRYVEVTGYPGAPTLESLEGRHVRSAVDVVGEFTCSNDLLNKVHNMVHWTLASSLQGYPQDAADRSERVGWTGDEIPEDYDLHFNLAAFWTKWIDDMQDAQLGDGQIPCIVPTHWREGYPYVYDASPVWQGTYPLVCWQTYLDYDDQRIMIQNFEGMRRLVDYFTEKRATDHIIPDGIGDHMEPQPDGTTSPVPLHTAPGLTSTAWYWLNTCIVAEAARLAGRDAEHRHYVALGEQILDAFTKKFFDAEKQQYMTSYDDGEPMTSQTANAVPLRLGMVPAEHVEGVVANIVQDIMVTNNGHLTTGFMGVDALAAALPQHGAAEAVYAFATRETFPSWGYMIARGATTVYESWDGNQEVDYSSLNMKLHCGISKFFYQALAGIRRTAPGYRKFIIKPCPVGDLTSVSARVRTVRGGIESAWSREDESFCLLAVVPPNSSALVSVPVSGRHDVAIREGSDVVWENGVFVAGTAGIASGHRDGDYVTFAAGSGRYVFTTVPA